MPTKQTVPLLSWRAAATVIISSAVYACVTGSRFSSRSGDVPAAHDVVAHPAQERLSISADTVPCGVEGVVPERISLRVRRMRSARRDGDVAGCEGWQNDFLGPGVEAVDDLLDVDQRAPRGEDRLFLHTDDAPHLHISLPVRTLRVDDADVWRQGRHRRAELARE